MYWYQEKQLNFRADRGAVVSRGAILYFIFILFNQQNIIITMIICFNIIYDSTLNN